MISSVSSKETPILQRYINGFAALSDLSSNRSATPIQPVKGRMAFFGGSASTPPASSKEQRKPNSERLCQLECEIAD